MKVFLITCISLVFSSNLFAGDYRSVGQEDFSHSFSKKFIFGVATAAHQIEGGNSESDWWHWEKEPGRIKTGELSGDAIDHWNRLDEDTQALAELGVQGYRFSIEWAKVEPKPNQWNWEVVRHYQRELALLRQYGIHPMITLHHFTFPMWVRNLGGWEWDRSPEAFARFAKFVITHIAPEESEWITINEPTVHLLGGYAAGLMPPGIKDIGKIILPMKQLMRAHALAYKTLHEVAQTQLRKIRVGIAHHLRIFDPDSQKNPLEWLAHQIFRTNFNWTLVDAAETGVLKVHLPWFYKFEEKIEGLEHTQDFIGVNYYTRDTVDFKIFGPIFGFDLTPPNGRPTNDLGWEIYPEGFYRILKDVAARYPAQEIIVTENGVADALDEKRKQYIQTHLAALLRAKEEGVNVQGYYHWTLMDNYEWIEGFAGRFGLYSVNRENGLERRLRNSGKYYRDVIKNRTLHN